MPFVFCVRIPQKAQKALHGNYTQKVQKEPQKAQKGAERVYVIPFADPVTESVCITFVIIIPKRDTVTHYNTISLYFDMHDIDNIYIE